MKKILFLLIFAAASASVLAQQENHYTMFMYNKMMYNPGVAGSREVPTVMALYRNQWLTFKGAPQSQLINFDTPIGKSRASLGAQVSHHQIGVTRNIFANLCYSYAILRTKTTSLRLGINASFLNYQYDFSRPDIYVRDGITSDLSISSTDQQAFKKGNAGAGLYFDHKNFYMGVSAPNMYENPLAQATNSAKQSRHYYAMFGALLPLTSSIDIRPAFSARFVENAPLSFDANAMFIFNKKFQVGGSYRLDSQVKTESADFIVFVQAFDKLGFGFSYDLTLSGLMGTNKGSIEALVRYDLRNANGVNGKFDNPRFFF